MIAALARRQYGLVTREQLLRAGLSSAAISRRVKSGRLIQVHAGVYAVGHTALSREARWLAAVLACGPGALLSHRSAAWLWGIRTAEGPRPDVAVPRGRDARHPGIRIHRIALHPDDCVRRARIPVTTPARTLIDLAGELEEGELVRTLREAQFKRCFDLAATQAALARRPRRTLRLLVDDLVLTQSWLEDRLLEVCERHGIPRPQTQCRVGGKIVDFLWPAERLVVETDGWQGHGSRTAFQADRATTNELQLRGYFVLRFTYTDLKRRPAQVAAQILRALQIRRALADPASCADPASASR